jgi:hypothetical protein
MDAAIQIIFDPFKELKNEIREIGKMSNILIKYAFWYHKYWCPVYNRRFWKLSYIEDAFSLI